MLKYYLNYNLIYFIQPYCNLEFSTYLKKENDHHFPTCILFYSWLLSRRLYFKNSTTLEKKRPQNHNQCLLEKNPLKFHNNT